ncbi:uncharacterized protein BDZ99DRAFT_517675 [Mytilinidion resinicola]|uniref:Uncharacterized protein n=1 Tax=Mytilinidion resinicola TaxID=574789 RepID=A0A6A6YYA1_9PEZI|nr:uncharacterized protein BDZ99DRAFT_517675 [Mytilinidion resinicola]KAF2813413.1 hypothetical protein BDZ99DRAFT_517675 [Mytilinidion resinicola]
MLPRCHAATSAREIAPCPLLASPPAPASAQSTPENFDQAGRCAETAAHDTHDTHDTSAAAAGQPVPQRVPQRAWSCVRLPPATVTAVPDPGFAASRDSSVLRLLVTHPAPRRAGRRCHGPPAKRLTTREQARLCPPGPAAAVPPLCHCGRSVAGAKLHLPGACSASRMALGRAAGCWYQSPSYLAAARPRAAAVLPNHPATDDELLHARSAVPLPCLAGAPSNRYPKRWRASRRGLGR